ncbi:hypothetical protein P8452_26853 [Trifolium repens]|nr:hypothetical protein P8452_26853 [Trifolium repens]
MEGFMFGNVRPSPESCDDRGKRPTQETESESEEESEKALEKESEYRHWFESEQKPEEESEKEPEKESESEQKPEEESETKPEEEWDWESKSLEEMQQKYDNDPKPRFFVCRNFVYENKVLKQQNEECDKAVDEYLEICSGKSPFDPIPIPRAANFRGHNFPRELYITEECLERFTRISQIALADYNSKKTGYRV